MDDLPKYKADPAFVKLGLNKSPETFTRGSNQYSSGGSQGTSIVSSQPVFIIQPPIIERPQRLVEEQEQQETCIGLQLFTKTTSEGVELWITSGTVANLLPEDMDPVEGLFIKEIEEGESEYVFAKIVLTSSNSFSIDRSEIITDAFQTVENTNTSFHYLIGYYSYGESITIQNYGCGSVDASVCRNWYASSEPYMQATFAR